MLPEIFKDENLTKTYFTKLFRLEKSGQQYPVDLDETWPLIYNSKQAANRYLIRNYLENVDYILVSQVSKQKSQGSGGHNIKKFMLTIPCMEYWMLRKHQSLFNIYQECRKSIQTSDNLPASFPDALRMLADRCLELADAQEKLLKQAPKVKSYDKFLNADQAMTMQEVCKMLNIKKMGRTNMFRYLRSNKIIMKGTTPYQKFVDQGFFKVIQRPLEIYSKKLGKTITIMNAQTLVTAKGLEYLSKKLQRDGYELDSNFENSN